MASALEGIVLKDVDGRWVPQAVARPAGYATTDRRRNADPLGLTPEQRAHSDLWERGGPGSVADWYAVAGAWLRG